MQYAYGRWLIRDIYDIDVVYCHKGIITCADEWSDCIFMKIEFAYIICLNLIGISFWFIIALKGLHSFIIFGT